MNKAKALEILVSSPGRVGEKPDGLRFSSSTSEGHSVEISLSRRRVGVPVAADVNLCKVNCKSCQKEQEHILVKHVLAPKDASSCFQFKRLQIVVSVTLMQTQLMAHAHRNCSMSSQMRIVTSKKVAQLRKDLALDGRSIGSRRGRVECASPLVLIGRRIALCRVTRR